MNFIYYLENERDLKRSSRNSKKAKFFKAIEETEWSYLSKYKTLFEKFDDKLRTPEVHNFSELADCFHEKTNPEEFLPDSSELCVILNLMMNMFWAPLVKILKGEKVNIASWSKGMDTLAGIEVDDIRPE
jgi:hypothetical protein